MRKLLIIFSFAIVFTALQSCKKTSFVAKFDKTPEARMADTIAFVKNSLMSAPNGWIVLTPVYFGGGYGFYMSFDDSMNVTMYSDLLDQFASESYTSQTRIRADLGAALTFESYNYITELNDPDNNVRNGYGGDVDYIYDHTNGDSIIFLGKRYRASLIFVKATAAEQTIYQTGGYLTAIKAFRDFFVTNSNAYISLEDGTNISIEPNSSNDLSAGKRITFTALDPKGNISSALGKFAYTVDQMAILDSGINIAGLRFIKIAWKDANTLAAYTDNGKEYVIKNSTTPILPLYMLMGVKYSSLYGPYKTILPGTSSDGATILNYYYNNLNNSSILGYSFNSGSITLQWNLANQRVSFIGFCSQNGGSSGWNTTIVYTYTLDANGYYTFTKFSAASGGYVSKIMTTLDSFLTSNTVKLGYYIDPATNTVYGQISSIENPNTTMTFQLHQ
ncbi:MAG: DUF4302 domain-containing protein [Arachidicoccus sp.]|nr:DUF4302 domain-containing protein [Arachidicoccus sp.]